MFTQTKEYSDARKNGELPIILALVESSRTSRIFSKESVTPEMVGFSVGLELWDGTHNTGTGTWGSLLISEWHDRVLSFGSIRDTLAPQNKDLIASYSQTEIPSYSLTIDNTDNWYFGIDEDFVEQTIEIWQGFNGIAFSSWQRLFQGEIVEVQFSNKQVRWICQARQGGFFETLTMPTASGYSEPYDPNAILPRVYGDLTENSEFASDRDHSTMSSIQSGVYAFPLIYLGDAGQNGQIYCLAHHAITSTTIDAYDQLFEQIDNNTPVSYGNYETQGNIAYFETSSGPGGAVVGSCFGKNLTNPLDILEDLLDYAEDRIDGFSWKKHETSWAKAKTACTTQGYTAAGIIISENTPAFWLTNILSNFLGDWWLDSEGYLHIYIDDGSTPTDIAGDLLERHAVNISPRQTTQSLCRQTQIYYAVNMTHSDKRFKEDANPGYYKVFDGESTKDTRGLSQKLRTFYFDWTRNEDTVEAVSQIIVDRFKDPVWVYRWQGMGNDFENCHVEKGDFVRFSFEGMQDENGLALINQVGQVLERELNLDEFSCSFVVRDTGDFWASAPDLWDGTVSTGTGTWGGDRERNVLA